MVRRFEIKNKKLSIGAPYIIAEAGINHDGNMIKAKMLIRSAKTCGADVIKFQTHIPEAQMLKDTTTASYVDGSIYDLLKRVELTKKQHRILKKYADRIGITFISTPFSIEAADLLDELGVSFFKIGSGQIINHPFITHIAKKNKPMIISTGMTTLNEIKESVKLVSRYNKKIALLHCTSTYPTRYEDVNLNFISELKKLGYPVGLSDHSIGIYTALGSIPLGSQIIEKHFTIDRNWPGPDQQLSIEPNELKQLVDGSRAIYKSLGTGKKKVLKEEVPVQKMARESIVSIRNINKGEKLTKDNIGFKRPGTGIPAKKFNKILGHKAKISIKKDCLLKSSDFK